MKEKCTVLYISSARLAGVDVIYLLSIYLSHLSTCPMASFTLLMPMPLHHMAAMWMADKLGWVDCRGIRTSVRTPTEP